MKRRRLNSRGLSSEWARGGETKRSEKVTISRKQKVRFGRGQVGRISRI